MSLQWGFAVRLLNFLILLAVFCPLFTAEEKAKRFVSEIVPPHKQRVGHLLPDVDMKIAGEQVKLSTYLESCEVLVIAIFDVDCPLSRKFGPSLMRLEAAYSKRGVQFLHLHHDLDRSEAEFQKAWQVRKLQGPVVRDAGARLQKALEAKTTTEIFVIDKKRTLHYRGAISDQYGIGVVRDKPSQTYVQDAIEAVLARRSLAIPQTNAPGCLLASASEPSTKPILREVTYHQHISRIMQKHCVQCHRPGSSAPFSLEHYKQVKRKAETISFALEEGIMPPWFASEKHGGPWLNEMKMSEEEKQTFEQWLAAGKKEGDPKDAPLPLTWSNEWEIGEPDLVLTSKRAVSIPAEGTIPYKFTSIEVDLPEDKWVAAVEVKTQAPQHMHHILAFVQDKNDQRSRAERRGSLNAVKGYFAGAVPGKNALIFPEGFAKRLPKSSRIHFQLHYTANGEAASDKVSIAFKFLDKAPKHEIKTNSASQIRLRIPPHAKNHVQRGIYTAKQDIAIISFNPHAHVRSTAFRYEVLYPNGKRETVLDIPQYDFNWQLDYKLVKPLVMPKNSQIVVSCRYDNSADNPNNPDPNVWVRFGDQTWDEMLIGYFDYYEVE